MSASSQGHLEVVKILMNKGVQVNQVAHSGGTAIMFSAGGGHNETTKFLIDSGADVNVIVAATPEYIADVAKAIAEGKEDAEPHKDGVTALMVAAQGGHIGTVKMLVEAGAVVDIADDEDMTPLLNAIKGNYGALATYLVEYGANPNDVYIDDKKKKHNLLMDAILVSNNEFAILLIDKGANVDYADEEGVSVATQAAYMGLNKIVKHLITKGANISVANKEGIDPLIAAASEGHNECLELILATGKANVNAKDKDGTNALMASSVRGHYSTVELLLKNGAEVNAQNADGHSALMFAYNGKNQVQTLLDKYKEYVKDASDNSTQIMNEALATHVNTVNLLLKYGADINLKVSNYLEF
jgi:ankyrin repeat protein